MSHPMLPDARMLDFFDRHVTTLIVEKYAFDERRALRSFLESETSRMLLDHATGIYADSPRFVFDLWECEQITGDPRNSINIRGE